MTIHPMQRTLSVSCLLGVLGARGRCAPRFEGQNEGQSEGRMPLPASRCLDDCLTLLRSD